MSKRNAEHVVVRGGTGPDGITPVGECLHCGTILRLVLPLSIPVLLAAINAFTNEHRSCPTPVQDGQP